MPACLKCGEPLKKGRFAEVWMDDERKVPSPGDISEDWFCARCNVRWIEFEILPDQLLEVLE